MKDNLNISCKTMDDFKIIDSHLFDLEYLYEPKVKNINVTIEGDTNIYSYTTEKCYGHYYYVTCDPELVDNIY